MARSSSNKDRSRSPLGATEPAATQIDQNDENMDTEDNMDAEADMLSQMYPRSADAQSSNMNDDEKKSSNMNDDEKKNDAQDSTQSQLDYFSVGSNLLRHAPLLAVSLLVTLQVHFAIYH